MKLKAFITLAQWLKNNSGKNKKEAGNKNKEIKRGSEISGRQIRTAAAPSYSEAGD